MTTKEIIETFDIPAFVAIHEEMFVGLQEDLSTMDLDHDGFIEFKDEYLSLEGSPYRTKYQAALQVLRRYFFASPYEDIKILGVDLKIGKEPLELTWLSAEGIERRQLLISPLHERGLDQRTRYYRVESEEIETPESFLLENYPTMIRFLRSLVERNTFTERPEGIAEFSDQITRILEAIGFTADPVPAAEYPARLGCSPAGQIKTDHPKIGDHLHLWRSGKEGALPIIIVGRLDTRYPLKEGGFIRMQPREISYYNSRLNDDFRTWRHDGSIPEEDRKKYEIPETVPAAHLKPADIGRYFGPGIANEKGNLVVLLFGLYALARFDLLDRFDIDIFLKSDGYLGSLDSSEHMQALTAQRSACFVFEGTDSIPLSDYPGRALARIFVEGVDAVKKSTQFKQTLFTKADALQRSGIQTNIYKEEGVTNLSRSCSGFEVSTYYRDKKDEPEIQKMFSPLQGEENTTIALNFSSPLNCLVLERVNVEGGEGQDPEIHDEWIRTRSLLSTSMGWIEKLVTKGEL